MTDLRLSLRRTSIARPVRGLFPEVLRRSKCHPLRYGRRNAVESSLRFPGARLAGTVAGVGLQHDIISGPSQPNSVDRYGERRVFFVENNSVFLFGDIENVGAVRRKNRRDVVLWTRRSQTVLLEQSLDLELILFDRGLHRRKDPFAHGAEPRRRRISLYRS